MDMVPFVLPLGSECGVEFRDDGSVELLRSDLLSKRRIQELEDGVLWACRRYCAGSLVLHGSSVAARGGVVMIVGSSGTGKSTLATLLSSREFVFVSDGMTPVNPDTLEVSPGQPRTKLDDESISILGHAPEEYEFIHEHAAKRYFPVTTTRGRGQGATNQDAVESFPLRHIGAPSSRLCLILVVQDAEATEIVPMSGAHALIELIRNVYLAEYLPPEHSPILMQRAAQLIKNGVQVKALRRKKDPSTLLEIVEAIEREAAALGT